MEQMKMQSMDVTASNIEKIAQLFPSCVTEFKDENGVLRQGIDFDKLRDELSDDVIERERERRDMNLPGLTKLNFRI